MELTIGTDAEGSGGSLLDDSDPNETPQQSITLPSQRPKWNLWKIWSQHIFKELNFHVQTGSKLYSKMGLARLFYESVDIMGGFDTLYNKIVNNHYFILEVISKCAINDNVKGCFKLLLEGKGVLSASQLTSEDLDIVAEENLGKCLNQTFELGDYIFIWGGDLSHRSPSPGRENTILYLNKAGGAECFVMHYRHDGQMPLTNEHGDYEYNILGSDVSHLFYAGAREEVALVQHIKPRPVFLTPVSNPIPIPSTSVNKKVAKPTSTKRLITIAPVVQEPKSSMVRPTRSTTKQSLTKGNKDKQPSESDSELPVECVDITLSSDDDDIGEAELPKGESSTVTSTVTQKGKQPPKKTPEKETNNQSSPTTKTTISVSAYPPTPIRAPDLVPQEAEDVGNATVNESMDIQEAPVSSPDSIVTSPEYETADEDSASPLPVPSSLISPEGSSKVLQDVFLNNGNHDDSQASGDQVLNNSIEERDKDMDKIETPTKVNGENSNVEAGIDSQPYSLEIYNEIDTQMADLFEIPQSGVASIPSQTKTPTPPQSPTVDNEPEIEHVSFNNGFGEDSFVTPHDESHIACLDENMLDAPLVKGGRRKSRVLSGSSNESNETTIAGSGTIKKRKRNLSSSSSDSLGSTKTVAVEKPQDTSDLSNVHDALATPAVDDPNKSLNAAKRRLSFPENSTPSSSSSSQIDLSENELYKKYLVRQFNIIMKSEDSQQEILNELRVGQIVYIDEGGKVLLEKELHDENHEGSKSPQPSTSKPIKNRGGPKTKVSTKQAKGKQSIESDFSNSDSESIFSETSDSTVSSKASSAKAVSYKKKVISQPSVARATRNNQKKPSAVNGVKEKKKIGESEVVPSSRARRTRPAKNKEIDIIDLEDEEEEEEVKPTKKRSRRQI